jgi:hypothetical protein
VSRATTIDRLAGYEQRYRELAGQLATIGLIQAGSLTRREKGHKCWHEIDHDGRRGKIHGRTLGGVPAQPRTDGGADL